MTSEIAHAIDGKRVSFKSICETAIIVAFVCTAAVFVVAQLSQVRFLPTVAREFSGQSEQLARTGDYRGAADASRKAVEIYRRLTDSRMIHFVPHLARSLHDLAVRLNEAGDTSGAQTAIEEAIRIRQHTARYNTSEAAALARSLAFRASIVAAEGDGAANMRTVAQIRR
jgi:hypothetical protein